jgi:hypothetical protein
MTAHDTTSPSTPKQCGSLIQSSYSWLSVRRLGPVALSWSADDPLTHIRRQRAKERRPEHRPSSPESW